jgi:hypothetical protein
MAAGRNGSAADSGADQRRSVDPSNVQTDSKMTNEDSNDPRADFCVQMSTSTDRQMTDYRALGTTSGIAHVHLPVTI